MGRQRLRSIALLLAAWTVPALISFGQVWVRSDELPRSAWLIFVAQLPAWYAWALLTPVIVAFGRRVRPRIGLARWAATHAAAAVALATARETILLVAYYMPLEGVPLTVADLVRGLVGNLLFGGLLMGLLIYGAVLGLAEALQRGAGERVDTQVEPPQVEPPQEETAPERIAVKQGNRTLLVDVSQIDWVEAADYYARLHVGERQYLVRESLARLGRRLAPLRFVQVHRSALVNLARVVALEGGGDDVVATLRDGTQVRVSRRRLQPLKQALGVAPER